MSDFEDPTAQDADCFWFPNLPKCENIDDDAEQPEESVPTGPIEQPDQDTGSEYLLPISGQVAYLSVALLTTSAHYLNMFRWKKDTAAGVSYYAAWKTYEADLGSSNFWKMGDQVFHYSGLLIFGIASITQLASFFALHDINMQVWANLVVYGTTFAGIIYNILYLLAINKTSGLAKDMSIAKDATIASIMLQVNYAWLRNNGAMAFVASVLWGSYRNWYQFQMDAKNAAAASIPEGGPEEGAEDEDGEGEEGAEGEDGDEDTTEDQSSLLGL